MTHLKFLKDKVQATDCMSTHSLWKYFLILDYVHMPQISTHVTRYKRGAEKTQLETDSKGLYSSLKFSCELRDVLQKYHAVLEHPTRSIQHYFRVNTILDSLIYLISGHFLNVIH